MRVNYNFSVKDISTCLNAANLWIETWQKEGTVHKGKLKRVYLKEVRTSLTLALRYMFGKDQPPLRDDLEMLLSESTSLEECVYLSHKFMEVFCYFISSSQDNYVSVHKDEYRMWRKEEDAISEVDPSDLIFL